MKNDALLRIKSNHEFVDAAYERVLQRPADPNGAQHFEEQLEHGSMTREDVLAALTASAESQENQREAPKRQPLRNVMNWIRARSRGSAAYEYQKRDRTLSYQAATESLRERIPNTVRNMAIPNTDPQALEEIAQRLDTLGYSPRPLAADADAYRDYFSRAEYATRYASYYADNQPEKTFEHFLGVQELQPREGARFVDIASEHSPVPEIYERLTGCEAYAQDLMFRTGLIGRRIGGDAGAMPVPDGFFQSALVSCSIEHFEGDADTAFMREMARTLEPGGRVLIAPLYLYTEASVQTDPTYAVGAGVDFDADAVVYSAEGWGNRHGRHYSPESLLARLIEPCPEIAFTVYRVMGTDAVDPSLYCRWALLGVRR